MGRMITTVILAGAIMLCLAPSAVYAAGLTGASVEFELRFILDYPSRPSYYGDIEAEPPYQLPAALQPTPGAQADEERPAPDEEGKTDEDTDVVIEPSPAPLGEAPGFDIIDAETPLGNLPQTGFVALSLGAGAFGLLAALSGATGAGAVALRKKSRKNQAA